MNPLVRDLYKRFMMVGRDYPGGLEVVRRKTKEAFMENARLTDQVEINRAIARGRWYLNNELIGVIKLKKYRVMNKRYGS